MRLTGSALSGRPRLREATILVFTNTGSSSSDELNSCNTQQKGKLWGLHEQGHLSESEDDLEVHVRNMQPLECIKNGFSQGFLHHTKCMAYCNINSQAQRKWPSEDEQHEMMRRHSTKVQGSEGQGGCKPAHPQSTKVGKGQPFQDAFRRAMLNRSSALPKW